MGQQRQPEAADPIGGIVDRGMDLGRGEVGINRELGVELSVVPGAGETLERQGADGRQARGGEIVAETDQRG
jgi:hypothetical protein